MHERNWNETAEMGFRFTCILKSDSFSDKIQKIYTSVADINFFFAKNKMDF